jgi:hypothetical protein
MSEGLGDFFGGGGGGAAAISWDDARAGDGWTGIIVPRSVGVPDEAYETTQATDVQGAMLYWNPNKGGDKRQITDSHTNGSPNQPVRQAVITLLTEFRKFEFVSTKFKDRAVENEDADDGTRRWFVKGGSVTPAFNNALRTAGVKKPEVGGVVKCTLVKRTPNDFGGKTNEFAVTYTPPTEATKAKAIAYLETLANESTAPTTDDGLGAPPF